MSRSSPGRYSLHDFAKNVYDVHAFGADGRELPTARPDPYGWSVAGHGGTVTVKYKVFGDRVDGTISQIDPTHAHINMPAAIMWAHGLDDRPIPLTLRSAGWRALAVATQLHPGTSPLEFTAPNLQYLMDSPAEFGPVCHARVHGRRQPLPFCAASHRHRRGARRVRQDVEKDCPRGSAPSSASSRLRAGPLHVPRGLPAVRRRRRHGAPQQHGHDQRGSLAHDGRRCSTPWRTSSSTAGTSSASARRASSRSTSIARTCRASSGSPRASRSTTARSRCSAPVSPIWRRRPRPLTGLDESVSCDARALLRSAEDMSRMAPFIDGGRTVDRTNWSNTVISYYPFGGAIALALDLTLRERIDGQRHARRLHARDVAQVRQAGRRARGIVDRPYTLADAEATLAEVSGYRAFAHEFFANYIEGHDVADYARFSLVPASSSESAIPDTRGWAMLPLTGATAPAWRH